MNIVIANGPGRLDNGSDVILFPSRWDSAVPNAPFYQQAKSNGWLITEDLNRFNGFHPVLSYPHYTAEQIFKVRLSAA